MLTLGFETIVVLLLIVGVVSAFGGYVVAQERLRRAGGGKSAAELKTELGEYKESVDEHFRTTAGLLHDMTEQYRAVYEHMAAGAQNLCDPETAQSQIESLRAGLLPSAAADTVESDSDEGSGNATDEETRAEPGESPGDTDAGATGYGSEPLDTTQTEPSTAASDDAPDEEIGVEPGESPGDTDTGAATQASGPVDATRTEPAPAASDDRDVIEAQADDAPEAAPAVAAAASGENTASPRAA